MDDTTGEVSDPEPPESEARPPGAAEADLPPPPFDHAPPPAGGGAVPPFGAGPSDGIEVPPPPGSAFEAGPASTTHRRWWLRPLTLVAAAILALLIGGGAYALMALRGSGDVLTGMAPADTDVYATVYLDPALKQKLNVRSLLQKFPAVNGDKELTDRIDRFLDEGLQETGLTFERDIRPWLGSQVSVVSREGEKEEAVLLLASKDDGAALDSLDKLRTGPFGKDFTWSSATRGGVKVWIGDPVSASEPAAYAVFDHTALLGNSAALINEIIDTAQGRGDRMDATADFGAAVEPLPEDRLGLLYVHVPGIIDRLKESFDPTGGLVGTQDLFGQLDAYRGLAVALSAQSDGVTADVNLTLDRSKLPADQRSAFQVPGHAQAALAWIPKNAYGAFIASGTPESFRKAVDQQAKADPTVQQTLDDVGLTGPDGAIGHLTGLIALEIGPGGDVAPAQGALLLGTDDEASMQRFLRNVGDQVIQGLGESGTVTGSGWQQESYRDVSISFLEVPDLVQQGIEPAYAVTGGVAILASSPSEIHKMLDARADAGTAIGASANFKTAFAHAGPSGTSIMYADIEAIARAIRSSLPADERQAFDRDTQPNLAPFKAFVFAGETALDHVSLRIFVLIR
jgi:hypothetical protein